MSKKEKFLVRNNIEILVEINLSDHSLNICRVGSFCELSTEITELFRQWILYTDIDSINECVDDPDGLDSIWACGDAECLFHKHNSDIIICLFYDTSKINEMSIIYSKRVMSDFVSEFYTAL